MPTGCTADTTVTLTEPTRLLASGRVVPISKVGNDVRPGKSRLLFTMPGIADYDVTKEGFLIAQSVEELHETRQINVILNWKRELLP